MSSSAATDESIFSAVEEKTIGRKNLRQNAAGNLRPEDTERHSPLKSLKLTKMKTYEKSDTTTKEMKLKTMDTMQVIKI